MSRKDAFIHRDLQTFSDLLNNSDPLELMPGVIKEAEHITLDDTDAVNRQLAKILLCEYRVELHKSSAPLNTDQWDQKTYINQSNSNTQRFLYVENNKLSSIKARIIADFNKRVPLQTIQAKYQNQIFSITSRCNAYFKFDPKQWINTLYTLYQKYLPALIEKIKNDIAATKQCSPIPSAQQLHQRYDIRLDYLGGDKKQIIDDLRGEELEKRFNAAKETLTPYRTYILEHTVVSNFDRLVESIVDAYNDHTKNVGTHAAAIWVLHQLEQSFTPSNYKSNHNKRIRAAFSAHLENLYKTYIKLHPETIATTTTPVVAGAGAGAGAVNTNTHIDTNPQVYTAQPDITDPLRKEIITNSIISILFNYCFLSSHKDYFCLMHKLTGDHLHEFWDSISDREKIAQSILSIMEAKPADQYRIALEKIQHHFKRNHLGKARAIFSEFARKKTGYTKNGESRKRGRSLHCLPHHITDNLTSKSDVNRWIENNFNPKTASLALADELVNLNHQPVDSTANITATTQSTSEDSPKMVTGYVIEELDLTEKEQAPEQETKQADFVQQPTPSAPEKYEEVKDEETVYEALTPQPTPSAPEEETTTAYQSLRDRLPDVPMDAPSAPEAVKSQQALALLAQLPDAPTTQPTPPPSYTTARLIATQRYGHHNSPPNAEENGKQAVTPSLA